MKSENLYDTNDVESSGLLNRGANSNENQLHDKSPEDIVRYLKANSKPEELEIGSALKEIINIGLPTILFYVSLFIMQGVNLMFISRTSDQSKIKEILNGVGISHLYVNCFLLSVVTGIVSAFGTLGANAFSSKNYYLMGLYFHRAQIIGYLTTICLLIFHYLYAVKIISFMGIEDEVLIYVDQYLKIMMFYVIFELQFWLNMLYLNIIKKSHMNYIIFFSTLLFHPLWCYIFIIYLDLGIKGAGISLVFSQMLNSIEGMIYIYAFTPLPESIFFFNRHSFKGLWGYLKVALPITVSMCTEWWGFELLSIVALWISATDYTVHILLSNFVLLTFSMSAGLGITATIIIGRAICDKGVETVKKYIRIFSFFSIFIMIVVDIFMLLSRKYILRIYVDDESILALGEQIIPLMCLMNIFEIVQWTFSSICKGFGKEMLASIISIIYYYVILNLFAYLFGKWLGWGIYGIWFGMMLNALLSSCTYSFFLFFYFDYEKIQLNVLEKLHHDGKLISSSKQKFTDEK